MTFLTQAQRTGNGGLPMVWSGSNRLRGMYASTRYPTQRRDRGGLSRGLLPFARSVKDQPVRIRDDHPSLVSGRGTAQTEVCGSGAQSGLRYGYGSLFGWLSRGGLNTSPVITVAAQGLGGVLMQKVQMG